MGVGSNTITVRWVAFKASQQVLIVAKSHDPSTV